MESVENVKIRPFARLLTMLGDQLIKDEIIAITELVKNAYDADAGHVGVSFFDFGEDFSINKNSCIIIEDDGNGMDKNILTNAWMNPATPEKLKRKKVLGKTNKGRIMQGEKGIGRFAVFKLGSHIQIITRRQKQENGIFVDEAESNEEYVLTYDFTKYDTDFLLYENQEQDIYLDDLNVQLKTRTATTIVPQKVTYGKAQEIRKPYGTRIIIRNLKGVWNEDKVEKLNQNLYRMQPIFQSQFKNDFEVIYSINGSIYNSTKDNAVSLLQTLKDKSVFIVDGDYNEKKKEISFKLDNHEKVIPYRLKLDEPDIIGIRPMAAFFESIKDRETQCGSFSYTFYIMDLDIGSRDKDTRYYLDRDEKESIKNHRVYLYRDNIRVLPYGDPEDDWLKIDMLRGTEQAGHFLGNDQVVGYVSITQEGNPNLRDKTNREGLIEEGFAKEDLVNICQLILRYIRIKPYAQYLLEKKRKRNSSVVNTTISVIQNNKDTQAGREFVERFLNKYGDLPVDRLKDVDAFQTQFFQDLEKAYNDDRDVMEQRISVTENLAAIGLSAETAYHDSRLLLHEIKNGLTSLIRNYTRSETELIFKEVIIGDLRKLETQISKVSDLMYNLQKLFPSTKNKKTDINVGKIIMKVKDLYGASMKKAKIQCEVEEIYQEPLIVNCTDAVLLQVFINLFDNSIYWLKTVGSDRKIWIRINSRKKEILFSDSGPGVREEDAGYIFEAFYSGKGENGKGLGLYIARQLLNRYHAKIELVRDDKRNDILNGATFSISFTTEELEK